MATNQSGTWKQIYPMDCHRVMNDIYGKTGVSVSKIINILIREGIIALSQNPDTPVVAEILQQSGTNVADFAKTSQRSLLKTKPIIQPKLEPPKPKIEDKKTRALKWSFGMLLEFNKNQKDNDNPVPKEYREQLKKWIETVQTGEYADPKTAEYYKFVAAESLRILTQVKPEKHY